MSNLSIIIFKIHASLSCNNLLYWVRRIPLIRKLFPENLYKTGELKQVLIAITLVIKLIFSVIGKFIYLGLIVFLPFIILNRELSTDFGYVVHIFACLSLLTGSLIQAESMNANTLKFICVRQMFVPADKFQMLSLVRHYLIMFLAFTPALMTASFIMDQPIYMGLILSIQLILARLIGEAFHVFIYDKTGKILIRNSWYLVILGAVGLACAYLPFIIGFGPLLYSVTINPITIILMLILASVSLIYLIRYPKYHSLVLDTCKVENISAELTKQSIKESQFNDVKLKESDLESHPANNFSGLTGYQYLNTIFFRRHRRILTKIIKIELLVIAAVCVAGIIATLLFKDIAAELLTLLPGKLPFFVFIMYIVANIPGTRICKAMFYNCDISLLRYGWYREKQVVIKNFTIRLRKIAFLNLSVASAICLTVIILTFVSGATPPLADFIGFLFSILCLSVFFSVHPLCMYYLFQPYTTSLDVKNPFFHIINGIVYFLSYLCINLDQTPNGFAVIVLSATIIYCVAALLFVWKRASKTFRVK